mmetsp:Transcript_150/g.400  ORF Transcript_150/g.400 Transcript_150/m.400 type:complete len:253 (-) Transcript_150:168-926(-)
MASFKSSICSSNSSLVDMSLCTMYRQLHGKKSNKPLGVALPNGGLVLKRHVSHAFTAGHSDLDRKYCTMLKVPNKTPVSARIPASSILQVLCALPRSFSLGLRRNFPMDFGSCGVSCSSRGVASATTLQALSARLGGRVMTVWTVSLFFFFSSAAASLLFVRPSNRFFLSSPALSLGAFSPVSSVMTDDRRLTMEGCLPASASNGSKETGSLPSSSLGWKMASVMLYRPLPIDVWLVLVLSRVFLKASLNRR